MSEIVQYLLVGLIVAAAVCVVVKSAARAARSKPTVLTACTGCKLQEICQKPQKNSAKKCADKVAQVKKSQ